MRLFAVAALAATLAACGGAPTHTVAPVEPGVTATPAPRPDTVVIDHVHWAITAPNTEGWSVVDNDEDGCTINRMRNDVKHVLPAAIRVSVTPAGDDAEQYAVMTSLLLEQTVGQVGTISAVKRSLTHLLGNVASLTQILTEERVFVGQLAVTQASTKLGYSITCYCPTDLDDVKLMATVVKTFTLKEAAPKLP